MKLRVWDENMKDNVVELNMDEMKELWVCLDLVEDDKLSQDDREKLLQKKFDEQFNRPDYNNWHRHNRHIGYSKAMRDKDGEATGTDTTDVLIDEVKDKSIFYTDEYSWDKREEWDRDDFCAWIREVLEKKPEWADAIIAIRLNGESVKDYAARNGVDENSVSQKLRRAVKKLKNDWAKRQI